MIQALTAYGAVIPKAFANRKAALAWAEAEGDRWPGCRIVLRTRRGLRTIWRAPAEERPAERAA